MSPAAVLSIAIRTDFWHRHIRDCRNDSERLLRGCYRQSGTLKNESAISSKIARDKNVTDTNWKRMIASRHFWSPWVSYCPRLFTHRRPLQLQFSYSYAVNDKASTDTQRRAVPPQLLLR